MLTHIKDIVKHWRNIQHIIITIVPMMLVVQQLFIHYTTTEWWRMLQLQPEFSPFISVNKCFWCFYLGNNK